MEQLGARRAKLDGLGPEALLRVSVTMRGAGKGNNLAWENGKIALVIEDEHQLRTVVALMLESAGFKVLEAAHPNEAASVWRQNCKSIDLIVADIWLPGISGPELAAFFRRECPEVKTVFISGLSADMRAEYGKLVRDAEIVSKPFRSEELIAAVERALSP